MKQSLLFTKTSKDAPKDEVSKNAILLMRAGFVHKEMAGVYSFLPLGQRVVEKITKIIKEEMDRVGGVQMKTSTLQSKSVWDMTGRFDDEFVDVWFKTKLKNGSELGLSFTNEEAYANIAKSFVNSYKDLPFYPYDFKTIFRNEIRSKSGIMRGREFYWKALYSFSKDEEEHNVFYGKMQTAYENVFERVGISDITYKTFASGGTFSKYSHEYQTISDAGEDTIYIDQDKKIAINEEVLTDEVLQDVGVMRDNLVKKTSIEVGNIFSLGYKFSIPFDLKYKDKDGVEIPVYMGSYGIGITRLMGTIAEVFSDDKGLIWPESVAPFQVHLLSFGANQKAEELYNTLTEKGIEVLYDDREESAGSKLKDADLIGIPYRVIVSQKASEAGRKHPAIPSHRGRCYASGCCCQPCSEWRNNLGQ